MASNQISNQRNRAGRQQDSGRQHKAAEHGTMETIKEQASDYVARGADQFREMTRDHEGTAVLVALAAGFGVGLVIGAALAPSHREPESRRYRRMAEGLGRRFLDRIEGMMPQAIAEHFGK
jgi:hypothetical protein